MFSIHAKYAANDIYIQINKDSESKKMSSPYNKGTNKTLYKQTHAKKGVYISDSSTTNLFGGKCYVEYTRIGIGNNNTICDINKTVQSAKSIISKYLLLF